MCRFLVCQLLFIPKVTFVWFQPIWHCTSWWRKMSIFRMQRLMLTRGQPSLVYICDYQHNYWAYKFLGVEFSFCRDTFMEFFLHRDLKLIESDVIQFEFFHSAVDIHQKLVRQSSKMKNSRVSQHYMTAFSMSDFDIFASCMNHRKGLVSSCPILEVNWINTLVLFLSLELPRNIRW